MTTPRWFGRCLKPLLLAAMAAGSPVVAADPLTDGFAAPPLPARARAYWWWLNGNVTEAAITRDLEQMKAKGMGGGLIFDADGSSQDGNAEVPAGPLYGSPEWRKLFAHTLKEADRLGLEIDLNITSGWNIGGPMVTPELAMKKATWSETKVTGGNVVTLSTPKANLGFYRDSFVVAYPSHGDHKPGKYFEEKALYKELGNEFGGWIGPDASRLLNPEPTNPNDVDATPDAVVDLTGKMDPAGKLTWTPPPGDWTVLRFGYTLNGARTSTSSGKWQGLSLDHMSSAPLDEYWKQVVDPLITDAGPLAGKAFTRVQTDSWEMGVCNWTPDFPAEFKRLRGYDLTPWMPALAGKVLVSRDITNRFLADFRRTVADLIAERHYKVFTDHAHAHGMGMQCESGGPHAAPIDALQCLGRDDMPMGEFWAPSWTHRVSPEQKFFMKQSASAAHIYGKPRACGEAFTSIGPHWLETPWSLKTAFDTEACEGLNLIYWHAFVCSPDETGLPGQQYFAGTHMNPKVTWWPEAGAFFAYLNRCQFLLQQGRPRADVLYYYGDMVPDFVRLSTSDPAHVSPGYDYDVVNQEVLLQASVDHGVVKLPGGTDYKVLVLCDHPTMSLPVLRKLKQLSADGATIIGTPPKMPSGLTDYPKSDDEMKSLVAGLWGEGKGKIIADQPVRQVLHGAGITPDFSFAGVVPEGAIRWIHRATDSADVYFVANTSDTPVSVPATFRVTGKQPELWSPDSGAIRPVGVYQTADGGTTVRLDLKPRRSTFVVFRGPPTAPTYATLTQNANLQGKVAEYHPETGTLWSDTAGHFELVTVDGKTTAVDVDAVAAPVAVDGPWSVHFAPGWGAPDKLQSDKLTDWTENADLNIKYFSGTADYSTTIDVPAESIAPTRRWTLDLGVVHELAHVNVNGVDLGTIWESPATVDVTAALKPGRNEIKVAVTNLWPNRIIGDLRSPPDQRKTRTNVRKFDAKDKLLPSGLVGPVKLTATEMRKVN